jgi:hypothetical protein
MAATITGISIANAGATIRYAWAQEIILDDSFDWTTLASDLSDVRFCDGDGTELPYWIEYLDYETKAIIWVRIPTVPAAGTTIYMLHSGIAGTPYQAASYTPHLPLPATAIVAATYPPDKNGNPLWMLHPALLQATGWMCNSVPDAADIDFIQVNTPYPYTGDLSAEQIAAGWTANSCELPGLWCRKASDSSWNWPLGTATWPYVNSGDDTTKALHRVHATMHPAGTNSNCMVAPAGSNMGCYDPTLNWLPDLNGGTLRLYFWFHSSSVFYYLDITSTNGAWSDGAGNATLTWTYPVACQIASVGDFTAANAKETGHTVVTSPTVIKDSTGWVMITASTNTGWPTTLQRWTSSDGITWTKSTLPTLAVPDGNVPALYHPNILVVSESLWLMFGTTKTTDTEGGGLAYEKYGCWASSDRGQAWIPSTPFEAVPRRHTSTNFSIYYHTSMVYVEGEGLYGLLGTKPISNLGGTLWLSDASWNPTTPRRQPNLASVFHICGLDASDSDTTLTNGSVTYPICLTPSSANAVFSKTSDTIRFVHTSSANGAMFPTMILLPTGYRMRLKLKQDATGSAVRTPWYNTTPGIATFRNSGKLSAQFRKTDNAYIAVTNSDSDVNLPFVLDLLYPAAGTASLQVLRHNSVDYAAQEIDVINSPGSPGYWRYQSTIYGTSTWPAGYGIDLYWWFAAPYYDTDDPAATLLTVAEVELATLLDYVADYQLATDVNEVEAVADHLLDTETLLGVLGTLDSAYVLTDAGGDYVAPNPIAYSELGTGYGDGGGTSGTLSAAIIMHATLGTLDQDNVLVAAGGHYTPINADYAVYTGTPYFGVGALVDGNFVDPGDANVRKDTAVGVTSRTGTAYIPTAANTRYNVNVDATVGALKVPLVSQVLEGIDTDDATGTYRTTNVNDVLLGVYFGPVSVEYPDGLYQGTAVAGSGDYGAVLEAINTNVQTTLETVAAMALVSPDVKPRQDGNGNAKSVDAASGAALSTLTQSQVSGGAYNLTNATFVAAFKSALGTVPASGNWPTVAQIATTVWQDATAGDFAVDGSIGKSLFTGHAPGSMGGYALLSSTNGLFLVGEGGGTVKATLIDTQANQISSIGLKVGGLNGDAMRGTDNAYTGTPPSASTIATAAAAAILETPEYKLVTNGDGEVTLKAEQETLLTPIDADSIAQAVWTLTSAIDGKTPQEALQIIAAVVAGKISGAGTGTETFVGLDGSTDRLAVTVDAAGNRSAMEYDP